MAHRRRGTTRPVTASDDVERTLAFVNTLAARASPAPDERLPDFEALAAWARGRQLVGAAAADRIVAEARRRPQAAAAALTRARELREALHAVFASVSGGRSPGADALDIVSRHLAAAYVHARLRLHEGTLQWVSGGGESLDLVSWEVARAAGRLLTSARLGRVRACAGDDCGWWFVDDSRNQSRRWCEMKSCGNREKLRRFRSRQS